MIRSLSCTPKAKSSYPGTPFLPHHPTAKAASSLKFLHPTGWTLAAAVRNELSTPGQGTQASVAFLSLPTPALPAGRPCLLQLAGAGRAARPIETPSTPLSQPGWPSWGWWR